MRIALVYDLLYPFSIGGVESRNFSLAEKLAASGNEVHLFGAKMWKGEDNIKVAKNIHMHGVARYSKNYSFSGKRKSFEPLWLSIKLFFSMMKHEFDVVDCSAFPYFPLFASKLYCIIKRKPLLVTWHEVWDDYWKEYGFTGIFGKAFERVSVKLSKNNICVSKTTAKRLEKISGKKSHNCIEIIPNWIDLKEIEKARPLKESYDIISAGRHLKHKNFDMLLRICAGLKKTIPGIRLLLIGEGPETIRLLKIRKALGLEKNADILSFTKDKSLLYSYMKSSKLFVLLSELEGFSITSFEAMACGLPVITLKAEKNALVEFIKDKKNGVICGSEVEAAENIRQIITDKDKFRIMSISAKRLATLYNDKKHIPSLLEKYYNLHKNNINKK